LAAGSYYGSGIYISTNSGTTWFNSGAAGANWNSLAVSADGNQFVAVAEGGNAYVWRTTPVVELNLSAASNGFDLSWLVPSTGFVLQENSDMTTTNWVTVTNPATLNLTNLNNEVLLSPSNSSGFFRLIAQ